MLAFAWLFRICMKSLILKWTMNRYANEDNDYYSRIEIIHLSIVSLFTCSGKGIDSKTKGWCGIIIENLARSRTDNNCLTRQRKPWKNIYFLVTTYWSRWYRLRQYLLGDIRSETEAVIQYHKLLSIQTMVFLLYRWELAYKLYSIWSISHNPL